MATELELGILAQGALAEVGNLSAEEREKVLAQAFNEAQEAEPAGFLGLNFEKWRQDAEVGLYKAICEGDVAAKKILEALGEKETDWIKYLTGLALAVVTPYGWLAALLAAVIVPFILKHIHEDLCAVWKKRLQEKGWLEK